MSEKILLEIIEKRKCVGVAKYLKDKRLIDFWILGVETGNGFSKIYLVFGILTMLPNPKI